MLGGSSPEKDRGKPVLKMAAPKPLKGQSLLPMNKGVVLVRGPPPVSAGKNDPRMVMVQGAPPNLSQVLGKNTVLVPVTASPDGKMIPTGGPVITPQMQPGGKNLAGAKMTPVKSSSNGSSQPVLLPLPPGAMIRGPGPQQNKPFVIMPANQMASQRPQYVIQVPKGGKGNVGQMVVMPVSSAGMAQGVTTPSTAPGVKLVQQKGPQLVSQPGKNKGVSLLPISMAGSSRTQAPAPMVIRLPAGNQPVNRSPAPRMVLIPGMSSGGMKQVMTLPSSAPNTKTMLIPDTNLNNLPKGTKLIPVSSSPNASSLQFNTSNLGALQGGKLVFIPNTTVGGSAKPIIIDPKTVAGGSASQSKGGPKHNFHSLIKRVGMPKGGQKIVYRQVGTTMNKPIQPKPALETTDTFFKTPIEIKPLEEEHDDDLENVLSALTGGGGNVDLMPVTSGSAPAQPDAPFQLDSVGPAQIDELENMGLKIDSVYSLSSNTVPWEGDSDAEKNKEATGAKDKPKENEKSHGKDVEKECGGDEESPEKEKGKDGSDTHNTNDEETQNKTQESKTEDKNKEKEKESDKCGSEIKTDSNPDNNHDNEREQDQETIDEADEVDMDSDVDSEKTEIMDDTDLYTTTKLQEDLTRCEDDEKVSKKAKENEEEEEYKEKEEDKEKEEEVCSDKNDDDDDSDGQMEDIQVPVLSIEPLSPEDEPSQSGRQNEPQQSHLPPEPEEDKKKEEEVEDGEETEMEVEDPEDDGRRKSQDDDDPNLMRGDCLQVRLAQQAARQLQEQMRQETETRNMVSAQWQMEEDEEAMDSSTSKSLDVSREEEEGELHKPGEDKDQEKPRSPIAAQHAASTSREATPEMSSASDDEKGPSEEREKSHLDTESKDSDDKEKESETSGDASEKKDDDLQDEAQKALVAAALNGCEVADSAELNDMFDELISEYFTAPERPKPSVRVRGIEECRADMDDGPQSLVTTTKHTPIIRTLASLPSLPKPVPTNKQYSINTSSGPITLVQVKVPVPGKPGVTAIKYIPMQFPKPGEGKAPMPQFIKIVPSTSSSSSSSPGVSKLITSTSNKLIAPAGKMVAMTTTGAAIGSAMTSQGKSLLKFVVAPSSTTGAKLQANLTTATSVTPNTSAPNSAPPGSSSGSAPSAEPQPLSNEDLASAVSNAARNVLGMANLPGARRTGLKPSVRPSLMPGRNLVQGPTIRADSNMRLLSPDSKRIIVIPPGMKLVQGPGGVPQLVMSSQVGTGPGSGTGQKFTNAGSMAGGILASYSQTHPREPSVIPKKKKKKKKKKIKLPKTKPCSVVLRRLNMKVIKKTVNLKRVKSSFLFEAISRQPMRGAKRKAEELLSNDSKKMKPEEKDTSPKTAIPTSTTTTDPLSASPTSSTILTSASLGKTNSSSPNKVTISKNSALYQIMSQLPAIKPAPMPGLQRPVGGIHTSPMKAPHPMSLLTSGRGVSLLQRPMSLVPGSVVSASIPGMTPSLAVPSVSRLLPPGGQPPPPSSKAITFTLSCTTAATNTTTPVLLSQALKSVALPASVTSSSSSGQKSVSSPVVSPSHGAVPGATVTSAVGGPITTVLASTDQPSRPLPPLHPASKILVPNIPSHPASGVPMPALQPAPRSAVGLRGPVRPLLRNNFPANQAMPPRMAQPSLPTLRPRPQTPIVIQPNGNTSPRSSVPSTTTESQADGQNKRFLLIKTANGQFLVPVPEQGNPISLAGAKPVGNNTQILPRSVKKNLSSGQIVTSNSSDVVTKAPVVSSSSPPSPSTLAESASTTTTTSSPAPTESHRRKRHADSPVIVIKDEPVDTGYDKYEHPPPPKTQTPESAVKVKEEKEVEEESRSEDKPADSPEKEGSKGDEDEAEQPRVPASLNHMKRIEELKARLRQHEEELAALRRERERHQS